MFPAPGQVALDALNADESKVRTLTHPTMVVHDRDDQVIPLGNAFLGSTESPVRALPSFLSGHTRTPHQRKSERCDIALEGRSGLHRKARCIT